MCESTSHGGWATADAPPPAECNPLDSHLLVILGPGSHVSEFLTRRRNQEDDVQHFLYVLRILFHFRFPDSCEFWWVDGRGGYCAGTVPPPERWCGHRLSNQDF